MSPSIDVIYALHMKPGDWYAGKVDRNAPTTPVQPFARAHFVTGVHAYTGDDGRKWLNVNPSAEFSLEPVLAASQVLVIRHLEGSQS